MMIIWIAIEVRGVLANTGISLIEMVIIELRVERNVTKTIQYRLYYPQ